MGTSSRLTFLVAVLVVMVITWIAWPTRPVPELELGDLGLPPAPTAPTLTPLASGPDGVSVRSSTSVTQAPQEFQRRGIASANFIPEDPESWTPERFRALPPSLRQTKRSASKGEALAR